MKKIQKLILMKMNDENIICKCIDKGYCHFDGNALIIKKNKTPEKVYTRLSTTLKEDGYSLYEISNVVFAIVRKNKSKSKKQGGKKRHE